MAGCYDGVQTLILNLNDKAKFVPCAAHSLNLVCVNAVERVPAAKLILGQIQNLYLFFSASPTRWKFLKEKLKVKLKSNSETRWSAKAQAVNALSFQYSEIIEVLTEMVSLRSAELNSETVAGAENHLQLMLKFKFLLSVRIWDNILFKIDIVNRNLQAKSVDLEIASKMVSG